MFSTPHIISYCALTLMGLFALGAQQASACGEPFPQLGRSYPESGAELPANAAVFIDGRWLEPEEFEVTVDGAPVAFEITESYSASQGYTEFAVRLEDTPAAGGVLHISGFMCSRELNEVAGCPVDLTYTLTAPDEQAPSPVQGLMFDVFEYPEKFSDACDPFAIYTSYLRGDLEAADAAGALEIINIYNHHAPTDEWYIRRRLRRTPGEAGFSSNFDGYDPELAQPGNECWRVEVIDAAGNVSAEIPEVCTPCHQRRVEVEQDWQAIDAGPAWVPEDRVDGGMCGDDVVVEDGNGVEDEGDDLEEWCTAGPEAEPMDESAQSSGESESGCSTMAGRTGSGLMMWLLALMAVRRRR
ncbi:MAG: hypothetical protein ACE366_17980 [Bradymonadia bacterium]